MNRIAILCSLVLLWGCRQEKPPVCGNAAQVVPAYTVTDQGGWVGQSYGWDDVARARVIVSCGKNMVSFNSDAIKGTFVVGCENGNIRLDGVRNDQTDRSIWESH